MPMRRVAAILLVLPLSVHAGDEAEAREEEAPESTQEPDRAPSPAMSEGTSLKVDQEFMRHLPLNHRGADRAFEELAELAPGVQRETYGISFHGASSAENDYRVDGLSARNPAFGGNDSPLSIEFLEEVNVLTGGYLPEHGRAQGGLISAVTRTGSNEFRGTVFVHWVPGSLEGQSGPVSNGDSVVVPVNRMKNLGDVGATLGGPIIKDRLWFFAGFAPSFTRFRYESEFNGIPGSGNSHFADTRRLQSLLKLTYRPVENHEVSVSLFSTPFRATVSRPLGGAQPGGPGGFLPTETTGSTPAAGLKYAGAFLDKKLLVEAHAGWFHHAVSTRALQDGGTGIDFPGSPRVRAASQVFDCFGGILLSNPVDRYQAHAKAAYLFNALGTHVLKAGADAELLRSGEEREFTGSSPECQGVQRWNSRSNTLGGFLQDSWTLAGRVTLNLGVRYDVQALYTKEGERVLNLGNTLSPRAGAEVDLLGDGRVKVFAHFARYHEQVPLYWIDRYFPKGHRPPFDPQSFVDPEIRPQTSTEVMAGAGYELLRNTRLGGYYLHRNLDSAIEDLSTDWGYTLFLGNPGSGRAERLPKAVRTYDAATLYLSYAFADGWLAQASYTLSRLHGNYLGLLRRDTEQLQPNIFTGFDDNGHVANGMGLLPLDRTHSLKLAGAKEFSLPGQLSTSIGVSYRGNSGTPLNFYAAHPDQGKNGTLLLQRGTGGRTPWVNTIDSQISVKYRFAQDQVVSLTLDVFNLFNFQAATRVEETFTYESVYPLEDGTQEDLPGRAVINTGDHEADRADPVFLREENVNPGFGEPVQRQAPRRFRFGVRYTF